MSGDLSIRDVMTRLVHCVELESSLDCAHALMEENGIRHLPVLDGHKLVGTVSQRELALLRGFPMIDMTVASVADAMADEVYVVSPDEPLRTVVREMAEKKYGSAIVFEGGVVLGIFTTIDALRVIERML